MGLFTILCVSEGSRSLMEGSDFVHCVSVSLIGTIVALFWAYWLVVWDWIVCCKLILYIIHGNGGPSNVVL